MPSHERPTAVLEPIEGRCSIWSWLCIAGACFAASGAYIFIQQQVAASERAELKIKAAVSDDRMVRMAEDLREIKAMLKESLGRNP